MIRPRSGDPLEREAGRAAEAVRLGLITPESQTVPRPERLQDR